MSSTALVPPNGGRTMIDYGASNVSSSIINASIDQDSINYLTAVFFDKNKDAFHIERTVPITIDQQTIEIHLACTATQPPVLQLAPLSEAEFARILGSRMGMHLRAGQSAHISNDSSINIKITLDEFRVSISGKDISPQQLSVKVVMTGFIAASDSALTIRSLDGEVFADGKPDPIVTIVFKVLIDILKARFETIPLPQPQYSGIAARLDSALVQNREIRCMMSLSAAGLTRGVVEGAERPSALAFAPASVKLSTGDDTPNLLVAKFFNLPTYRQSASTTSGGFGIRAELFGGVQPPRVKFANDTVEAITEIGLRASAGVQVFGQWVDVGVTPFDANIDLLAQVLTDPTGRQVIIKFIPNFDSLKVDFGITLPGALNFLLHPIQDLLGQLVKYVLSIVKSEMPGIRIPVFTVTEPLAIYRVSLGWTFSSLGIRGDKLEAVVSAFGVAPSPP